MWHNGQPALYRTIVANTTENRKWTTVETVLVRFNTSLTPSGRFPVYSNQSLPYYDGPLNRIGYDAAVCVQQYEPWIIEAYNASTGSPSALGIIQKGDGSTSLSSSGNIQGSPITNTRYLNTTGKDAVFSTAHESSLERMLRINFELGTGWESYVPPPIVGPVVPPRTTFFSNLDLPRRPFTSPKALDFGNTLNSPQTGSALSAHGLVRLPLYHTLWGRDLSSHNRTRMRRWHIPLMSSGS